MSLLFCRAGTAYRFKLVVNVEDQHTNSVSNVVKTSRALPEDILGEVPDDDPVIIVGG